MPSSEITSIKNRVIQATTFSSIRVLQTLSVAISAIWIEMFVDITVVPSFVNEIDLSWKVMLDVILQCAFLQLQDFKI